MCPPCSNTNTAGFWWICSHIRPSAVAECPLDWSAGWSLVTDHKPPQWSVVTAHRHFETYTAGKPLTVRSPPLINWLKSFIFDEWFQSFYHRWILSIANVLWERRHFGRLSTNMFALWSPLGPMECLWTIHVVSNENTPQGHSGFSPLWDEKRISMLYCRRLWSRAE